MKKDIHPEYREVIFKDVGCDYELKTRSSVKTEDTIVWQDGKEYPLVKLQVSSASHPFFTGKERVMDTAGRIDRFKKKYGSNVVGTSTKKQSKTSVNPISSEAGGKKLSAKEALAAKFGKKKA